MVNSKHADLSLHRYKAIKLLLLLHEWGSFSALEELVLDHNALTGETASAASASISYARVYMPAAGIGAAAQYLQDTMLLSLQQSGSIRLIDSPSTVRHQQHMCVHGTLPESATTAISRSQLGLRSSCFALNAGELPASLKGLKGLVAPLYVSFNKFTGECYSGSVIQLMCD
jgi:hypothetical protein